MTRPRKKRPAKRRKTARKTPHRWYRMLWKASLAMAGMGIGVLGPWLVWLDHQVATEFEGRKWDLPGRVFARPLSLYADLEISERALELELAAAGYRRTEAASVPGTYSASHGRYRIHRRPFAFDDGTQGASRFTMDLAGGRVSSLEDNETSRPIDLVRLDPAEIASIFPLHDEDRTLVSLDQVPGLLVTGLQAVEDRQFKHHPGVDIRGIARALVANLRAGKTVQGGSTLTQQLVKNFYLGSERTWLRKFNEAWMALLLEWRYDKSAILEAYVNEIYLGQHGRHGIHGFGRASEFYFGVPLRELQPDQVALLVGMVRGASLYNPRRNPARALHRRNRVLDMFAETGIMSEADAGRWKARPLGVTSEPGFGTARPPAFIDMVRRQLRRHYREEDLRNEGLRIFTTLAPSDQVFAEQAVAHGLRALTEQGLDKDLQAALVLADTASGEVRALVGGREPGHDGFNRALDARRQVGSVIKPLVYLAALEHDREYNLLASLRDEPIRLHQPDGSTWSPANYDGRSHGDITVLQALAHSYNQATVRLGMNLGVHQVIEKIGQAGINVEVAAVPAILLGAVELTPVEVAQMYQSLAAGGFVVPLRAVTAVQTPAGETLNRYPLRLLPLPRRDAVAVLNYALTQVVEVGTARSLPALLGTTAVIAGKTGTTNERKDSWFAGYTRDRIAAVWVGRDDNRPAGVTGSNAAMQLWAELFRKLPLHSVDLDMPQGAYWTWVEPRLNALSDPSCPGAVQLPFVAGSEPRAESPCLAKLEERESRAFWRKWFDHDQGL